MSGNQRTAKTPCASSFSLLLPDKRLLPLLNDAGKLNAEIAQLIERSNADREGARNFRRGPR
jgi:hypothetical protein